MRYAPSAKHKQVFHQQGYIEFEELSLKEYNLALFSINGKKVHQSKFSNQQIINLDVRYLDPGIYFIIINSNDEIYRNKIVIE